jgi:peptidoglycan/LPS O-acetylase OafA/YrhL
MHHYRADIDGLRAVAIVPVVLFHAGVSAFPGGFVGVDVFFVISGFLITGLIRHEIDTGTFSLVNFYERRVRRLLPALFAMLLAVTVFAAWLMLPADLADYAKSVLATSLFASNFLFWQEAGYFGRAAEEIPLLHTWSLAVEEQFYILFPLFLVFVATRCARRYVAATALVTAGRSRRGSRSPGPRTRCSRRTARRPSRRPRHRGRSAGA